MLRAGTAENRVEKFKGKNSTPTAKVRIPRELRWAVWERDDFTCKHCGTRRDLAVDHIHPESRGGTLDMDNLQTLCRVCNSRKGKRIPADSERENEVLRRLSEGETVQEIAVKWECSGTAVYKVIEQARESMGAETTAHAVALYVDSTRGVKEQS